MVQFFASQCMYLASSNSLNPVDHSSESLVHNIGELKQHLLHIWRGMDESTIDSALTAGVGVFKHVCGQTQLNSTLNK